MNHSLFIVYFKIFKNSDVLTILTPICGKSFLLRFTLKKIDFFKFL